MVRRIASIFLLVALLCPAPLLAAVRGKEVMYVGGTIKSVPEATVGELDTQSEQALNFNSPKGSFSIPYGRYEPPPRI